VTTRTGTGKRLRQLKSLAIALACATLTACSTNFESTLSLHRAGRFPEALGEINAVRPRDKDRLLYEMERGKVAQDAGQWGESVSAFFAADDMIEAWNRRAVIDLRSGSEDAAALLLDERDRTYRPSRVDMVLVQTQAAISYLLLGEFDLAAVKARRQIQMQEWAESFNAEARNRLDEQTARDAQEAQALADPRTRSAVEAESQRLRRIAGDRYFGHASPFAYYLGSLVMRAAGYGSEHEEFARRLRAFAPDSDAARWVSGPPTLAPRVYVVFENGVAPERVPISEGIAGAVVPLPRLVIDDADRAAFLRVTAGPVTAQTAVIGSVDALIATDFNDRLWELWGRPIASMILKITSTAIVANQFDDSDLSNLIWFAGFLWLAASQPDLRTWRSLPGEQQVTELDAPADGSVRVELIARNGAITGSATVPVSPDGPTLVYARSTRAGVLAVWSGPLRR